MADRKFYGQTIKFPKYYKKIIIFAIAADNNCVSSVITEETGRGAKAPTPLKLYRKTWQAKHC